MTQTEHSPQETGEIHKRLMRNQCPKCTQDLQVTRMNAERITRYCGICKLTIEDRTADVEMPNTVCD